MAGYDVNRVKGKLCISCSKPIGNKPYEEVKVFARFGQMLFKHKDCKGDPPCITEIIRTLKT